MSHTPRRLRPPKPVTVLRWMGETRLDAEAAAAAKRQYLKASQRGIVLTDARWEAYNPAITPAPAPKPAETTIWYSHRPASPWRWSYDRTTGESQLKPSPVVVKPATSEPGTFHWTAFVVAWVAAMVTLIWTEVAR